MVAINSVFQSLFYWMSLYNLMPEGIELPLSPAVSILILLDVPLQPMLSVPGGRINIKVSILILLDVPLQPQAISEGC